MRPCLQVLIGVLAAGVAACGDGGGGSSGSGPVGPTVAPGTTPGPASWAQYHGAVDHAGVDAGEPAAASPHVDWKSPPLDGQMHAAPLMLGDGVYVATEHDSVYRLDAATGAIRWQASLGTAVRGGEVV